METKADKLEGYAKIMINLKRQKSADDRPAQTGSGQPANFFEPNAGKRVQWSMGRLKNMTATLLPLIWLVAFACCPLEASASSWLADFCASSSSTGDASPLSGDSVGSPDDCVRGQVRRLSADRIHAAQPRPGPVCSYKLAAISRLALAISWSGDAFLLQQRWQFVWRTADSPRAPSSLA